MTLQLGILLALLCAVASNMGNFRNHQLCQTVVAVHVKHPMRSAPALWRSTCLTIGMGVGAFAWALHVAALSMGPLWRVQVVLAGGVVLIAVMAARMFGFEVGGRQWIGLGLRAAGL